MNYANIFAKMFPERNFCKVNMFLSAIFKFMKCSPSAKLMTSLHTITPDIDS